MSRRSRFPWLIIIGIILLVILIAALFLFSPSPQPVTIPSRAIISSMDFVAPQRLLNPHHARSQSTARRYRPHLQSWPIPAYREMLPNSGSLLPNVSMTVVFRSETKKLKKSGELSYTIRYVISTIVQDIPAAAASRLSAVTSGASQRIEAATNSAS